MKIRKAVLEDIPTLAQLRKLQLIDEGHSPVNDMDGELSAFFHRHMADGSMVEWVAEEDGEIVATGAVVFYDFPPTFEDPQSWRAYVTNMYTAPAYRRRGIATQMLHLVIDEARRRRTEFLWLGASAMGKPVYESVGFHEDSMWLVMHDKG